MKRICCLGFLLILITGTIVATPEDIPSKVNENSKNETGVVNSTLPLGTDNSTTTSTEVNTPDLSNSTSTVSGSNDTHTDHNATTPCPRLLNVVVSAGQMDLIDLIEATAFAEAFRKQQPQRVSIRDTQSQKSGSLPTEKETPLMKEPTKDEKSSDDVTKENIVTAGDKPIGENTTTPVIHPCGTNEEEPEKHIVKRDTVTAAENKTAENSTVPADVNAGKAPEGNKTKSMTAVTLEKTVETILQSVNKKNQHHPKNDTAKTASAKGSTDKSKSTDVDIDIDPEDDYPETARHTREVKAEKKLKTETSTHNATLDEIEKKLTSTTVDEKVIREVLESLLGESKTEEILPKNVNPSTKSKRSISPEKLPKRRLSTRELKMVVHSMKPDTIELKKFREKRSSDYGYMSSSNSFPELDNQLPELLQPALSPSTGMGSYGDSVDVPSMNVPEGGSRSASNFKYAVRTRSFPRTSIQSDFNRSPTRSAGQSGYDSSMSSTKFLTDLSDLPISRDFPTIQRAEYENNDAVRSAIDDVPATKQFQKVRVTYEYETPVDVSLPSSSSTRSRQRSSYGSDMEDTPEVKSGHATGEVRLRSNGYSSEARMASDVPLRSNGYSSEARMASDVPLRSNGYSSETKMVSDTPLPLPMDLPIRISFDITPGEVRSKRYRRSTTSKEISKRRVPMVLSAVSRFTRSGSL